MVDQNYLGHTLIYYLSQTYGTLYKCKECNIIVSNNILDLYFYIKNINEPFRKLNLRCDEMIIKGLLE